MNRFVPRFARFFAAALEYVKGFIGAAVCAACYAGASAPCAYTGTTKWVT